MIKFDVKNRFTGDIKFTAEIDCAESADNALKLGLAVKWALENGANLEGAYLADAYLEGAYLEGAYLRGADLRGAYLEGAYLEGAGGLNDWIKCIQIEGYPITYTADILQIGCQKHDIEEWREFDNRRISEMDGKEALKFWAKYKEWIFQTIELCPAKPTRTAK